MSGLVSALLVAASTLLLVPTTRPNGPCAGGESTPDERALLVRLRWPLSLLAVAAGWALLGSTPGLVAGVLAGVLSWRVLAAVEAPGEVRRRRAIERDLPMAVHLLGRSLAAGSTVPRALADVAESLPGPVGEDFLLTHHRLALGSDPVSVWRSVEGALLPLGRAMARAHESGASVVAAVDRLGVELTVDARLRRDALARTVEVRAAAPLGLCFLPAFLLVGVVPMVVGIFSSLRLFG